MWTSANASSLMTTLISKKRIAQEDRMGKMIHLGLHLEFALVLVDVALHPTWLPLGGGHAAQIALCLGTAALTFMLWEMFEDVFRRNRNAKSSGSPNPRRQSGRSTPRDIGYRGVCSVTDRRSGADRRSRALGGRRASDGLESRRTVPRVPGCCL